MKVLWLALVGLSLLYVDPKRRYNLVEEWYFGQILFDPKSSRTLPHDYALRVVVHQVNELLILDLFCLRLFEVVESRIPECDLWLQVLIHFDLLFADLVQKISVGLSRKGFFPPIVFETLDNLRFQCLIIGHEAPFPEGRAVGRQLFETTWAAQTDALAHERLR